MNARTVKNTRFHLLLPATLLLLAGCAGAHTTTVETERASTVSGTEALPQPAAAPVEAASTPGASPAAAGPVVDYTVRPGDSLWKIAHEHQTSVRRLRELNGLPEGALIRPGMKLRVIDNRAASSPSAPAGEAAPPAPTQ